MKPPCGRLALIAGCLALVFAVASHAHTAATTFVSIKAQADSTVLLVMDVHVLDLQLALHLDVDDDAAVTWGEIQQAGTAIADLVLSRSELRTDAGRCRSTERDELAIADHDGEPYVQVALRYACEDAGASLLLDHSGWFAADSNHRTLLDFTSAEGAHSSAVLTGAAPSWRALQPDGARLLRFLVEGVRHLVSGYDHLAFLCVLLLGLARRTAASAAVPMITMFRRALVVITSFTLAHSLTLLLAATGALTLPSGPVEIAIAASVLIAACLNLSRFGGLHGWALALGFGLVHGLGFAGALADVTAKRIDLAALAAFNVGIELGQVALALPAIPAIWLVARSARGGRIVLPLASLVIAVIAAGWIVERSNIS